jgi:predicted metal-dependent hydrolase
VLELTNGKVESIRLRGMTVKYRVQRSATARRRRLRVSPAGVVVVLPEGHSAADAVEFLRQNSMWVTEGVQALSRLAGSVRTAAPAANMLLQGEPTKVLLRRVAPGRRPRVEMESGRLTLYLSPKAKAAAALEQWLRNVARQEIHAIARARSRELGVRFRRIYIRGQRTKWGNCSRLRNLSFNWRLAMVPQAVLDYLVVHELAHLKEMSHGPKFWLLVRQVCPTYGRHQEWLRRNAHRLAVPDLAG